MAFLRHGWHALTPSESSAYRDLVGRLANKLTLHVNAIEAYERGRRNRGLPPIRKSARLGFTHDDWLLVEHLGPAIQAASSVLPAAPKDALRTLRRILAVAKKGPSERMAALFSGEATSRVHSVMVGIAERLMSTSDEDLCAVTLDEAQRLVERHLPSTSPPRDTVRVSKVKKRKQRPVKR